MKFLSYLRLYLSHGSVSQSHQHPRPSLSTLLSDEPRVAPGARGQRQADTVRRRGSYSEHSYYRYLTVCRCLR